MKRVAALALTASLLAPAPASAASAEGGAVQTKALLNVAPATRVYGDALVRAATLVGQSYWRERGAHPCALDVFVYDEPNPKVYGRAELGGCAVYWPRRTRNGVWAGFHDAGAPLPARRYRLAVLCQAATHEVGHTLGLQHTTNGIMAPSPLLAAMPARCAAWAKWMLPRRARPAPRGSSAFDQI